jgi:hypothetical protein
LEDLKMNAFSKLALAFGLVVVATVGSASKASPVEGRKFDADAVDAYSSVTYTEYLSAGELTTVYVSGDGDTDLDLFIYDENGVLIDSDTDYGDECVATVVPNWTGRFTIVVRNLGSVYNRYTLNIW